MSARVYLMKTVNGCKDVSIMSPQDEQWSRRTSLLCLLILQFSCLTKYNRMHAKHKQTKCEHSRRNSYRLQLSQKVSHYTKSKNYLERRYRIHHWIPMFNYWDTLYLQQYLNSKGCVKFFNVVFQSSINSLTIQPTNSDLQSMTIVPTKCDRLTYNLWQSDLQIETNRPTKCVHPIYNWPSNLQMCTFDLQLHDHPTY